MASWGGADAGRAVFVRAGGPGAGDGATYLQAMKEKDYDDDWDEEDSADMEEIKQHLEQQYKDGWDPDAPVVFDGDGGGQQNLDDNHSPLLDYGDDDDGRPSGSSDSGSESSGGANNASNGGDSAALKYMQEYNARQKRYKNYDALASYVPQILGQIDPKAGEVAGLGADVYRIFKGFYTNDWGSGIEGTLGVLKMFGLFKGPGAVGVSNAQLLSEIQKVGIEVSEMHALTKAMNATLNETLKQAYRNNLQTFDNAVISLHFNFDTQGYYLRRSYRSDIEYELKRAFGLMEIYHNIFDPYTKGIFKEYNTQFCAALDRLEALDAGLSPEKVCEGNLYAYRHYKNSVHCNTFDRDIGSVDTEWRLVGYCVPVDLLDEYVKRLHGRSPWEDMLLAGMVKDVYDPSTPLPFMELAYPNGKQWYEYEDYAHGIGFNGKETSSTFKADVITYCDGALRKGMTLWNDGKNLKFPDDPNNKHWCFRVLYFEYV